LVKEPSYIPPVWLALVTSDWISIAGTTVSVTGFVATLTQLGRVRRAVREEEVRTAGAMLQALTADVERIEHELRAAETREDVERVGQEWRHYAGEMLGLLDALRIERRRLFGLRRPAEKERARQEQRDSLEEHLQLSLGLLSVALEEVDSGEADVREARAPVLSQMGEAALALGVLSTSMVVAR
jgi:hypothetical protein